jgi:hypothetical protein
MITPTHPIRVSMLSAALMLSSAGVLAQEQQQGQRAVETRNYEFGLASIDSDTSGSTSNGTLGISLGVTQPIGSWIGVALSGYYSSSKVRTGDVLGDNDSEASGSRPSCSFDNSGGDITLFVRRPTLGRIAGTYGVSKVSPDCGDSTAFIASGDDKLSANNYRIDAEAYLGDFTVGASRTSSELDDGPKLESTALAASWYPLDSLKLTLSGNDLYEQDTYGVMIEHQPEFLGDAFGINVGYSNGDKEPKTRTLYLGMTYYFGTHVSLKTRDRQYR